VHVQKLGDTETSCQTHSVTRYTLTSILTRQTF